MSVGAFMDGTWISTQQIGDPTSRREFQRGDEWDATPLFSMTDNRYKGFDVAPDGERFLILQKHPESEDSRAAEGIVIVQNWLAEFR